MWKKILSTFISFIMVFTTFMGVTLHKTVHAQSNTDSNVTIERFAGADRYSTAVEICKKGWNDKSEYAVLANGENFPDALSAAPLAKKYNAPILLTSKDVLNDKTKSEMQRLNVKQVLVVGGPGVISENVESTLNSMNINVKRFYGKDRYETSIKVAEEVGLNNNGVFVTNGENFPDALSVAPVAAQKGMPIILVPKDNLTESTDKYVSSNSITKSYVIGNSNSVSEGIASKFKNTERIFGENRYATNVAVIEKFENDLDFSNICVANGENFPDGLSGSVLAASGKEPILLVNEQTDESTKVLVNKKSSLLKKIRVLGASAVVSDNIAERIRTNFKSDAITFNLDNLNKVNIGNTMCTMNKVPMTFFIKADINSKDELSKLVFEFELPLIGKKYTFDNSNIDLMYDDSLGGYYISFEIPALCDHEHEGYDFTKTYDYSLKASITSTESSKEFTGKISYLSKNDCDRILKKYGIDVNNINAKTTIDILNTSSLYNLEKESEKLNEYIKESNNITSNAIKLNDILRDTTDEEYIKIRTKANNIYTKIGISKQDFINANNSLQKDLLLNRLKAEELNIKSNELEDSMKQIKAMDNKVFFIKEGSIGLATFLDFVTIKDGWESFSNDNNIFAKKAAGLLEFLSAAGDISGVFIDSLSVVTECEELSKLAADISFYSVGTLTAASLATDSVETRQTAVDEYESLQKYNDSLAKEFEQRKLDMFFSGREDFLKGKISELSNDKERYNQEMYDSLITGCNNMIDLCDKGYFRYAYSTDLLGWLDWMGLRCTNTTADTIKSSNQLALGVWKSFKDKDELLKYYKAGYNNRTDILKLINIDSFDSEPVDDTKALDSELKKYIPDDVKDYQFAYLNLKGDEEKEALILLNRGGYEANKGKGYIDFSCSSEVLMFEKVNGKWVLFNTPKINQKHSDLDTMEFNNMIYLGNLKINNYDSPVFLMHGEGYSYRAQAIAVFVYNNSINDFDFYGGIFTRNLDIYKDNKLPQTVLAESKQIKVDPENNEITIDDGVENITHLIWNGQNIVVSKNEQKANTIPTDRVITPNDGMSSDEYYSNNIKTIKLKIGQTVYFQQAGEIIYYGDETDLYQWIDKTHLKALKKGTFKIWLKSYSRYFIFEIE